MNGREALIDKKLNVSCNETKTKGLPDSQRSQGYYALDDLQKGKTTF